MSFPFPRQLISWQFRIDSIIIALVKKPKAMFSEEKVHYKEITFDLILPINDTENFGICQKLPLFTRKSVSGFLPFELRICLADREVTCGICCLGFVKLPSFFLLRLIENLFPLFIRVPSCKWAFLHCQLTHYRFSSFSLHSFENTNCFLPSRWAWNPRHLASPVKQKTETCSGHCFQIGSLSSPPLRICRQVRPKPLSLISDSFYLVEHPLLPSQQNRSIPMPSLFKRLN